YLWAARASAVLVIGLVGVHAGGGTRARTGALVAILVLRFGLLVLGPIAVRAPLIDVWQLHQHALSALVHGHSPYATPVPDVYEGRFHYGPGYRSVGYFDYLPLNLVFALPGYLLFGDYRFSSVAAILGTVLLLRAAGRRLGARGDVVDVLTLALI